MESYRCVFFYFIFTIKFLGFVLQKGFISEKIFKNINHSSKFNLSRLMAETTKKIGILNLTNQLFRIYFRVFK